LWTQEIVDVDGLIKKTNQTLSKQTFQFLYFQDYRSQFKSIKRVWRHRKFSGYTIRGSVDKSLA